MKHVQKVIRTLIALALCVGTLCSSPALAAEAGGNVAEPYAASGFEEVTAILEAAGSGIRAVAEMRASVGASKCQLEMTVQKPTAIFFWKDIKTWTKIGYSSDLTLSSSFSLDVGCRYRLKVVATTWINGKQYQTTVYSDELYLYAILKEDQPVA